MYEDLASLSDRLKVEQKRLLLSAASNPGMPSGSTLERVAQLELNIAAIENLLAEERSVDAER